MAELEQFCILARTQRSRACAALIQQVLSHKKIFVFSELLDQPSVQSLRDSEYSKSLSSLELFAFGSFKDYEENRGEYLELSEPQVYKLKQLTLASMAANCKVLSYDNLLKELSITSLRELEDLIIDSMYSGILTGKLDQKRRLLRIQNCIARDVRMENIDDMIDKLKLWQKTIRGVAREVELSSQDISKGRTANENNVQLLQAEVDAQKRVIMYKMEQGLGSVGDISDDGGYGHSYVHEGLSRGLKGNDRTSQSTYSHPKRGNMFYRG